MDASFWLFVLVCDCVECIITQIDVVLVSYTYIFALFASVARIILRASICHCHDNAGTLTATGTRSAIIACDLVAIPTHSLRATWAFPRAFVLAGTVIALAI